MRTLPSEFTRGDRWDVMLKRLVDRQIASLDERLVLLAPESATIPASFNNTDLNDERHMRLLSEVQRLRGAVYLKDGAITEQDLTVDGLHRTPEDNASWHLLMTDAQGRVDACVWYRDHDRDVTFERLRARHNPLAQQPAWREVLRRAVDRELKAARDGDLRYAELGGWAAASESQSLCSGLLLAIASFSLGRVFGGSLGMTTATVRHCSSTILRRLGGTDLVADHVRLPSYFDARYNCEMELLRFDSRFPNPKYAGIIDAVRRKLSEATVVKREASQTMSIFSRLGLGSWPSQRLQVAS